MRPLPISPRLSLLVAVAGLSLAVGGGCGESTSPGSQDASSASEATAAESKAEVSTSGSTVAGGGGVASKSSSSSAVLANVGTGGHQFAFELRDGSPAGGKQDIKRGSTQPLAKEVTDGLLKRLPSIGAKADDVKEFAMREGVKPPPLKGKTVQGEFPPKAPDTPAATVADKELKILRIQPEGELPLVPRVSVTFNQPMVAVTSHEELKEMPVPVKLNPQPKGEWRWLGTKTVAFQPEGRAPMATNYTITVPKGIKSASGAELAEEKVVVFTTPTVKVVRSAPGGDSIGTEPLMYATFNQKIDAAKVFATMSLQANGKTIPIERLTEKQYVAAMAAQQKVPADKITSPVTQEWGDRWVGFRATEKLATDTSYTVKVGPGTPSAEGPRATDEPHTWSFKTYGPFNVKDHRCGWGKSCRPDQSWRIEFTNAVDPKHFDPSMVTVSPKVAELRVHPNWRTLSFRGMFKGRTKYTVTLSPKIKDTFGQTLGKSSPMTFDVGPANRSLTAQNVPMMILDPDAKPQFTAYVTNYKKLHVRGYKVKPEQWRDYLQYRREQWRDKNPPSPPGRKVFDKLIETKAPDDVVTEMNLDLASMLDDGTTGQVVLIVNPQKSETKDKWELRRHTIATWIQATKLGIDFVMDHNEMVALVTSLKDGKRVAGANVLVRGSSEVKGVTDDKGISRFGLPSASSKPQWIEARRGKDVAFMPGSYSYWSNNGNWHKRSSSDQNRWYVFDDRKLYKPGETVRLKGWVRKVTAGPKGDVVGFDGKVKKVTYRVVGSRGNELAKGEAPVNINAGFNLEFALPKTPNLGQARVELSADGGAGTASHRFNIQEFRRPEFEVSATSSAGPHIVGGDATVSLHAKYFSGGPLPNAEVTWRVTALPGSFRPPNQTDYTFGYWTPWWESRSSYRGGRFGLGGASSQTFKATTDGGGKHHLELGFKSVSPAKPTLLTAAGTVIDVNRQAWSSSANLLVHPSSVYVGLKTERTFVEKGQPIKVDAVVADIDGKVVTGTRIDMRMVRITWEYTKGEWKRSEVDEQKCTKTSAAKAVMCEFKPIKGGRHRVYAKVMDNKERVNESRLTIWVPGGDIKRAKNVELEALQFIPTKKEFQPGETAEILVQAPFAPAEGVLTISRGDIVEVRSLTFTKPSQTIKVKIEEWQIPNLNLHGFAVGSTHRLNAKGEPDPKLPKRPAVASGTIRLSIPPRLRTLTVEATPAETKLEPGGSTNLVVQVKGPDGKPMKGAEVAVVVVDESVLALTGYKLPDPVSTFYTGRHSHIRQEHLRTRIRLASLDALFAQAEDAEGKAEMATDSAAPPSPSPSAAAPGGARGGLGMKGSGRGGGGAARSAAKPRKKSRERAQNAASTATTAIKVRKDFNALALFAPELPTDAEGRATVAVKLPDNLTRYRVMVVAIQGDKMFGQGESAITARMPIMVRMSAPRFLNFGDRFELPIVVQNQTDKPLKVDVAVRSTNATFEADQGQRVNVPANDRVEVRFKTAAYKPGTARFQVGVQSGKWADASEVKLPVWTPATTEAFATYGVIDKGAIKQPIRTPGEVVKQFGGVQVQTSSTQLQALTDAVMYIYGYKFECSEQLSSRILAIAALKDVLSAFDAPGLAKPKEMLASVARDMRRLQGMQNSDGGFGFWRRGPQSWPFNTVHVAHALVRAKAKGFKVPPNMYDRAMRYLKTIDSHFPSYYTAGIRRVIKSYALYVRAKAGDQDSAAARQIMKAEGGAEKAGFGILGWLYPVFTGAKGYETEIASIRKHLNNRVTEEAGTAHFASSYDDGAHFILHSSRRADGILLEGLIGDQPKSDLIPKVVRGLLAHRKKGRWGSTQENAWVLLGLDKYFNTYEKVTPNFVARVWLGDGFAGEHAFKGRTTDKHQVDIPMAWLAEGAKTKDLVIAKSGEGRMYYRVGMTYAPASLKLDPMDRGFTVMREYVGIDKADDVKRDKDGTWRIKAGAKVRVRVTMVAPTRRYHVALVDPIPAGLEALNPALRGTEAVGSANNDAGRAKKGRSRSSRPSVGGRSGRGGRIYNYNYWGRWYEHDNLRDERAEAFRSLLYGGVYEYAYVARATTPGRFVVPPAKAEQMYAPEVFGRSASDVVIVQ